MKQYIQKKRKILIWIVAIVIVFTLQQCTKYFEEWVELVNTPLVIQDSASVINFYDNYDNDSISSNKVAKLSFPEESFSAKKVVISMHLYKNVFLSTEFTELGYARQSFLGKDSSNRFIYFLAKEQSADFITNSNKKIDIELKFNCLTENEKFGYRLFRIKMPKEAKISINSMKEAGTYNSYELYYTITGRSRGASCLSNWEPVPDAEVTMSSVNKKEATAKFTTDDFSYVYCLAAHIVPFEMLKDAAFINPGTPLNHTQIIKPAETESVVENFFLITADSKPFQQFIFAQYKNNLAEYKNLAVYETVKKIDLSLFVKAYNFYPTEKYTVNSTDEQIEFKTEGSSVFLKHTGEVIKRQFNLPPKVAEKFDADFGWYSTVKLVETETVDGTELYRVDMSDGAKIFLTKDFKYAKITNRALLKNLIFFEKLKTNPELTVGGSAEINSIIPFLENDSTVQYYVALSNKAELILNSNGIFRQMFNIQIKITEIPLPITIDIWNKFNAKPLVDYCFKNISIDGKMLYKVELENSKIAVYELIDAKKCNLIYEQDAYYAIPTIVSDAIALNNDLNQLDIEDIGFYSIDGKKILSIDFLRNMKKSGNDRNFRIKSIGKIYESALFNEQTGEILGRIQHVETPDLLESIKTFLAINAPKEVISFTLRTKIISAKPQNYYKVYMESGKEILFTIDGKPINWD